MHRPSTGHRRSFSAEGQSRLFVVFALVGNQGQSQANSLAIDDIEVWDTASPASNIPSLSIFDADGHPIASILPGGSAGERPMVTRTAYNTLGQPTDVTVNAIAGAGTSAADTNLTTHSTYDDLGRVTDSTDPAGHVGHQVFDRLGRVTSGITDYGSGHLNLASLAAYDAIGEVLATCTPNAVAAGCTASNITTNSLAWRYSYDDAGHQTAATPPDNTTATDLASISYSYELGGAGLLHQSVQGPRTTTMTYDALQRTTQVVIATTGIGTLTTTSTLDGAGRTTRTATSGTSTDTLNATYDALDRLTDLTRGTGTPVPVTHFVYNTDGTVSDRTDYDPSGAARLSSFTYTDLGQLSSASLPGPASAGFTWRLDGSLASRTWGSYISGTYSYDGAKRPSALTISRSGAGSSDTLSRTYDRASNVAGETQTLGGVSGEAGTGTQSFTYDAANRVTAGSVGGQSRSYGYDPSSNRTSATGADGDQSFTYDATDALIAKTIDGNSNYFAYTTLGDLATSYPGGPNSPTNHLTAYTYDPASHLESITADGTATSFTIDALGRHASQTVGTDPTTTYGYIGTSQSITTLTVSGTTTTSGVDAIGDRITTDMGGSFAYVLPDLHGNVVATISSGSTPIYLSAYRYDPYGQTCATYVAGQTTDTNRWRFQGRILESASGSTDLYDFGARSYDPSLGTFTSFDSVAGGAQNPATLNRYLYANGNPSTFIDPDGHRTVQQCTWDTRISDVVCTDQEVADQGRPGSGQTEDNDEPIEGWDVTLPDRISAPCSASSQTEAEWCQAITLEDAEAAFSLFTRMRKLAWNWPENGCWARAEVMAEMLAASGIAPGKIWSFSHDWAFFHGYPAGANDGETGNLNIANPIDGQPPLNYGFHVAVTLPVRDRDGTVTEYVLDPVVCPEGPCLPVVWGSPERQHNVYGITRSKMGEPAAPYVTEGTGFIDGPDPTWSGITFMSDLTPEPPADKWGYSVKWLNTFGGWGDGAGRSR